MNGNKGAHEYQRWLSKHSTTGNDGGGRGPHRKNGRLKNVQSKDGYSYYIIIEGYGGEKINAKIVKVETVKKRVCDNNK
jgi:hypothetical protein